jgi:hypothetical protein
MIEDALGATVADLRRGVSPMEIARLITAIVVDAIKRQALRRIEHVGEES